jgi:hypothetical protein
VDCISKEKVDFIGIQETKQKEFSKEYLETLVMCWRFCWNRIPPIGVAGGILVGVNSDVLEVHSWTVRKFIISCDATDKKDKFRFRITIVYGSAYDEEKQDFIDELHDSMVESSDPLIIGGDFNLVRSYKDKNNGKVDQHWCDKFNEWINRSSLLEIKLLGRSFTWQNN